MWPIFILSSLIQSFVVGDRCFVSLPHDAWLTSFVSSDFGWFCSTHYNMHSPRRFRWPASQTDLIISTLSFAGLGLISLCCTGTSFSLLFASVLLELCMLSHFSCETGVVAPPRAASNWLLGSSDSVDWDRWSCKLWLMLILLSWVTWGGFELGWKVWVICCWFGVWKFRLFLCNDFWARFRFLLPHMNRSRKVSLNFFDILQYMLKFTE